MPGIEPLAADAGGPDLRALRDAVVEAAVVDREGENAPRLRCHSPGCRVLGVEGGRADVDRRCRDRRNRGEARARPSLVAVVVGAVDGAGERQPIDHAAGAVGGEDLPGARIESEAAEGGNAGRGDVGELRHRAGGAVDAPDRARAAAGAELALDELGTRRAGVDALRLAGDVGHGDLKAVDRGRGEVEVGLGGVVNGNAEDGADLRGGNGEGLGRGGKLALGPERGQVDDAGGGPLRVEHVVVERVGAVGGLAGDGAGKAGHDGVAGRRGLRPAAVRQRRRRQRPSSPPRPPVSAEIRAFCSATRAHPR